MKNLIMLIAALFGTLPIFAQAPKAMNYQGVARDLSGGPIPNQNIGLRMAILEGSAMGTEVYKETQLASTNGLGLFSIQIGNGTPVNGNFNDIDWRNGSHFLQIEMDGSGGSNYQLLGTSQLLSVPYALYAENGSKWKDSQFNGGLQYDKSVIIGEDLSTNATATLGVNNTNPNIGLATNTLLATFRRSHNNSNAIFNIYGYPDTDLVHGHLRNSIMLYTTSDAKDMVLCAAPGNGSIRFVTDDWDNPLNERARITNDGLGIGTTAPQSKLHVKDGDIFLEDINSGVIMKSSNGQCWRYTPDNSGQLIPTAVTCPN